MRRRDFITLLGGATAAWPLAARAQQPGRMRRIALLVGPDDNAVVQVRLAAFLQELERLGWVDGNNLRLDLRFANDDPDRLRAQAADIVRLAPDVIPSRRSATRSLMES